VRLGRLDLAATAGAALPQDQGVPMSAGKGSLRIETFPARLAFGWTFWLAPRLTLVPALGGGLDLVLAETRGINITRRSAAVEPTLEAGFRAMVTVTQRVWIDLQAFQGIDIRPEEFLVGMGSAGEEIVLMTPRAYTRLGLDFGVYLGKN
jgi:hypothetical protein